MATKKKTARKRTTSATKTAATKTAAKKTGATKKTPATKKTSAKKSGDTKQSRTKRGPAKKPGAARKYGQKASEKVAKVMSEMKRGTLRSGGNGRKVTSPKQAIAIGLSEARRAGGKVPKQATKQRARKKSA